MTDNCSNAQACCPPNIWQPPPIGVKAQMSGLLWTLPCTNLNPPHDARYNCGCNTPADSVTVLSGDGSQVYQVSLLFRGVMELELYSGGSIIADTGNLMISGGAPSFDGHNIYSLIISNPAATYYLNRWDGIVSYGPCYAVRYIATIQVAGGASVTLHADPFDGAEITNYGNLTAPTVSGDPAILVPQPYGNYGQFLQCDAIAIL